VLDPLAGRAFPALGWRVPAGAGIMLGHGGGTGRRMDEERYG